MKSAWSTAWKASSQPRKQRKYRHNAPLHLRRSYLSAALSKELRTKHKRRNIPLRQGDKVKVMRGSHRGHTGKIADVDLSRSRVTIQGLDVERKDGNKSPIPFQPSNLMITELNMSDTQRKKLLEA